MFIEKELFYWIKMYFLELLVTIVEFNINKVDKLMNKVFGTYYVLESCYLLLGIIR